MFSLWQQAAQNHIRLQTKTDKSKDQLVGNEAFFYLLTLNSDKLPALKCVDVFISGGSYGGDDKWCLNVSSALLSYVTAFLLLLRHSI